MLVPSVFSNNFMDDLFDDMFYVPVKKNDKGYKKGKNIASMNTDVQEFDDRYEMEYELPGFEKKDIQAELKDGYLTVSASHTENNDEKDKKGKYIRRERYVGEYQRSFYIGEDIMQEEIKANFDQGILKLIIPKKETKPEMEEKHFIDIEG